MKYTINWSKTYRASGTQEIEAPSVTEAERIFDNLIGGLEGSMQYFPDENTMDIVRIVDNDRDKTKPMSTLEAVMTHMCDPCRSGVFCGNDCVKSVTCSLKCSVCGESNYFPGNLDEAPYDFRCVQCSSVVSNIHRKPEYKEEPDD